MRVLLVTQFRFPHIGGLSSHLVSLQKALKDRGYSVKIISFSSLYEPFSYYFVKRPFYIIDRFSKGLGYLWRIPILLISLAIIVLCELIKNKPDVINAHDVLACISSIIPAKIFRIPVVLTVHGYYYFELLSQGDVQEKYKFLFLIVERLAYRNADHIITVDERIKSYVINYFYVPSSRLSILHNFVDIERLFPVTLEDKKMYKRQWGILDTKNVILCPRRLVKKNGVIYALMAIGEVLRWRNDVEFLCVGDGPEELELKDYLSKNPNLSRYVHMLGAKGFDEMVTLYKASNVVVVPSISIGGVEEATSISVLESMASGVPVVASDIGGLREIIKPGENGILVPEKDPRELAKAIVYLLNNPEVAVNISRNAREFIVRNYSSSTRINEILNIFESVL